LPTGKSLKIYSQKYGERISLFFVKFLKIKKGFQENPK